MIVWIDFQPGAGGDGFANLLEQSSNAVALDHQRVWRVHRYVDSRVKFWAPNLKKDPENRINDLALLDHEQQEIANSDDQYLIMTSHCLEPGKSNRQLVSSQRQIRVLVVCDPLQGELDHKLKNLFEFDHRAIQDRHRDAPTARVPDVSDWDLVVDIDRARRDWCYVHGIASRIGLELPPEAFVHYRKLVSGELLLDTPGIEYYESREDDRGIVRYHRLR